MLKKELEEIIKQKDEQLQILRQRVYNLQFKNDLLTKVNERRFNGEDSLLSMGRAIEATAHVVGDLRQIIVRLDRR